jgi:hypothetical protein
MARRFAVDVDNDLLFTQDEAQRGTDPRDADSDNDGFMDGTEVRFGSNPLSAASLPTSSQAPAITRVKKMYHTARVAKILVEADRPVKLDVVYSNNLGDSGTFVEDHEYKTMWEVALRDLQPSNETAGIHSIYSGTITVRDEFGSQAHAALPMFETMPFINAEEFDVPRPLEIESVLRDLELVTARPAGPGLGWNFTFQGRVDNRKFSAPAPVANHVIVARVLRNGIVETNIDMNGGPPASAIQSDLNFSGQYGGTGGFGPFVVGTISDASGVSTITFRLPDALRGDDIQLSVEMVGRPLDVGTFVPTAPHFDNSSLYDYANTPREYRAVPLFQLPYVGYVSHVKSLPQ